ncbi:unnamed protein product [Amoebophrya sp. A120]|nr:unnamed protein product [Amoebophrya sp. A120]|eukprot:GSA120T00017449001.1
MEGDYVSETQQKIGSLITKPKMTEKYLKKPPFRFLHDIVMEVIRVTGFANNLFTEAEQDAGSMTDKNAKIDFLTKIISATYFATGLDGCDVLPNKIVAGLECEKTNAWLCQLHAAATSYKANSNSAVQRVLGGETTISKPAKKAAAPPPAAPAPPSPAQPEQPSSSSAAPKRDSPASSKEKRGSPSTQKSPGMQRGSPDRRAAREQEEQQRKMMEEQQRQERIKQQSLEAEQARLQAQQAEAVRMQQAAEVARPSSAQSGQRHRIAEQQQKSPEPVVQQQPAPVPRERPRTAGRKPPRVKKAVEPTPTTGGPPVQIIADDEQDEEEEEQGVRLPTSATTGTVGNYNIQDEGGHGKLVREILEEKKALESQQAAAEQDAKSESADGGGIVMGKLRRGKKKTAAASSAGGVSGQAGGVGSSLGAGAGSQQLRSTSDVGKLQETVQLLCQAANPLGKSMDLVHADISSMAKELDYWKNEYRQAVESCRTELKTTEEILQKSYQSVAEVEERIQEETSKIHSARARVLKNDQVIRNLLQAVVSSHS